jgi:hypothetical protein
MVLSAEATVVVLDADYKPVRVPYELKDTLVALQKQYNDETLGSMWEEPKAV